MEPKGITEKLTKGGTKASIGARTYRNRLAWLGIISSLNKNLMRSASGCKDPWNPTRLGPIRSWMKADILRSRWTLSAQKLSRTKITDSILTSKSK